MLHSLGHRRLGRPALLLGCVGALAILAGPASASNYGITANGTPVTTTTTTGGESAKLTFAGTAGNRVSMRIYGVTMSPKPNTGIKVSIQKPDGSTLVSPFDIGSGGTFMEPVTTPVNGTYTIVLDGQSTYKGKATVALWTVAADQTGATTPGGAPVTLALPNPGQNGTVTFSATLAQQVSLKLSGVTMNGNALNSARVSVLKPDATVLVANSNFGSSGSFLEPFTIPATGTYTVKIDPRQWYAGSATITVYDVAADQSGAITAGIPLALTFAAGNPGQNATETFSGTAGQKVSLNLTNVTVGANTISGTRVSILKPDATLLVAATDVGTNGRFVEPVTLPTTGAYTVRVDPQGANTGGITLRLAVFGSDTTGSITANGSATVVTSTAAGQNGTLTFTGSVNQRIALNLSTNFGTMFSGAKVSVKSPSGTSVIAPVVVGTNGAFVEPVTLTAAGTYTVKVDPDGANTGNVTLNLYTVPNDVSSAITAGGAGVAVANTVPGQNMKLSFTATANQKVSIKLNPVTIGSNAVSGTTVTLLKGTTTVGFPTLVGTNGGYIDVTTLATAGTYTIKVDPQGVNTGSLTATLYTVPADPTGSILTNGSATVSTNTVPGQNMNLTFAGAANQKVSLNLSNVTIGSSPGGGTLVAILKPDGTTFYGPFSLGTDGTFMDTKTLPVTGTYKIKLDPIGANTGSATLKLYTVPADISATITKNGPGVTPTTTVPGQNATVTFTGVATDLPYTLSLGPSISSTVLITITGPTGIVMDTNSNPIQNSAFNTNASTAPFQIPVNGTYTIKIDYVGNAFGATPMSLTG
jgi:acetyltransferase-like isoleucine patch superfamily enzyme